MDLKELLGEELYAQVMEKAGDKNKLAIVSDGTWFPKAKFDEVNDQKKLYKEQADGFSKSLEDMKKSAVGNEALTQQLEDMKKQIGEKDAQMKDVTLTGHIDRALIQAKAKHTDLLLSKIDKSKVVIGEDGKLTGLDDQIATLQTSYKELFGETVVAGNPPGAGGTPTPAPDESKMSDAEWFKTQSTQK
jgi:hypothetical protein